MKDEAVYAGLMPDMPETPVEPTKRNRPGLRSVAPVATPVPAAPVQPAAVEEEILLTPEGEEEVLFVDTSAEDTAKPVFEESDEDREALKSLALGRVKFSIKLKLGLSLAILLVGALLLLSLRLLNDQSRNLMAEMESRARIMSSGLTANLKEGFDEPMTRHPIVAETGGQVKDLLSVRIYDTGMNFLDSADSTEFSAINDKIVSGESPDTAPAEIAALLNGLTEQKTVPDAGKIRFTIIQPVTYERTVIGYAVMEFTRKLILDRIDDVRRKAFLIIGIAIALGLTLFWILLSLILAPIKRLILGVRQLADKPIRKVHPIRIKTGDELEQFSAEFNNMIKKLQDAEDEKEKKKKLEQEIQIGQDLQKNLLPDAFPESECFSFDSYYKPKSGMGGDYYDILQIHPDTIGVIIADVCGKGVPAAIIMVIIRTIFQSVARFVDKPAEALHLINKNIAGRTAGEKYATMFYYMFHTDTGLIEYANAAQTPLMVYHQDLHEVREYGNEETPPELQGYEVVGAPIGAQEQSVYFGNSVQVKEGDLLILSTDGITEAMNAKHELYDENDLKRDIIKFSHLSPTEIRDKIISSVEAFQGDAPQNDDRTLLVFKVEKIGSSKLGLRPAAPVEARPMPMPAQRTAAAPIARPAPQRVPAPMPVAEPVVEAFEPEPIPVEAPRPPVGPQRREVRIFRQPPQQQTPAQIRPATPQQRIVQPQQTMPQQRIVQPQQPIPQQSPRRIQPVQPVVPVRPTAPIQPAPANIPARQVVPHQQPLQRPQQTSIPQQRITPQPVQRQPAPQQVQRPVMPPQRVAVPQSAPRPSGQPQQPQPVQTVRPLPQQRPVMPGMAPTRQPLPTQPQTRRPVPPQAQRPSLPAEIVEEEVMFDE